MCCVIYQGGDQLEVRVDLPQASLLNTLVVRTLDAPPNYIEINNDDLNGHQPHTPVMEEECDTGTSDGDLQFNSVRESDPSVRSRRSTVTCNEALETRLGLRVINSKWKLSGQHTVGSASQLRISKSQGVEGYRLAVSWKNPGKLLVYGIDSL